MYGTSMNTIWTFGAISPESVRSTANASPWLPAPAGIRLAGV
jgi:hypothetical protein